MPRYTVRIDSAAHADRSVNPGKMTVQLPHTYSGVTEISVVPEMLPPQLVVICQFVAAQANSNARLAVGNLVTDATTLVSTKLVAVIAEVFYQADTTASPHTAASAVVGLRLHPVSGPWQQTPVVSLNAYPPSSLSGSPNYSASTDATGEAMLSADPQELYLVLSQKGEHLAESTVERGRAARFPIWEPSRSYSIGDVVVDGSHGAASMKVYKASTAHYSYTWSAASAYWDQVTDGTAPGVGAQHRAFAVLPPPRESYEGWWGSARYQPDPGPRPMQSVNVDGLSLLTLDLQTADGKTFDVPSKPLRGAQLRDRVVYEILIEAKSASARPNKLSNLTGVTQFGA